MLDWLIKVHRFYYQSIVLIKYYKEIFFFFFLQMNKELTWFGWDNLNSNLLGKLYLFIINAKFE